MSDPVAILGSSLHVMDIKLFVHSLVWSLFSFQWWTKRSKGAACDTGDLYWSITVLFTNLMRRGDVYCTNSELSICTTVDSRTVGMPSLFMCACVEFVIRWSSQFYNTQRTWQPLWWGCNVWCFTVAEAIRRANRKLPTIILYSLTTPGILN